MATLPAQKPDPRIIGQMVLVNWLKHKRGLTDDQISVILGLKSESSIAVLRRFEVNPSRGQTTWYKPDILPEFFLWDWQPEARKYLLKRQSQPEADTAQIDLLIQIISEPSSRVTPEEAAEWANEINKARRTVASRKIKSPRMIQNPNKNQKVDISSTKEIGSGSESVYVYYFPTCQLYNKLCLEVPYFPCNVGCTKGDVKTRISHQIGQQLPEKAKIALVIRTEDCEALEDKIHEKLKRENLEDAVGTEWFLTNPAEVEGIFKSIHSTKNFNK
ncbi:hypothetical protein C6496_01760 [Candidatus Poribacteria bacterium]|nr:MAG: hypothetical protein C6496_01760 [Candidatus Poribacteria bacterium]